MNLNNNNFDDETELKNNAQAKIANQITEGQQLIYKEKYAKWQNLVVKSASDMFYGEEIDASLKIMQMLENDVSIEAAAKMLETLPPIIETLVRNIVFKFSNKGPEFYKKTAKEELSPEDLQIIKNKENENAQLAKTNEQSEHNIHI